MCTCTPSTCTATALNPSLQHGSTEISTTKKNRPPDPKGSLSSSLPSQAIAEANWLISEAVHNNKNKRGSYYQYSPAVCLEIAKYSLIDVEATNTESYSVLSSMFPTREIYFYGNKFL